MSKVCLKCSHENTDTPTDPLASCPKCGAIYSRVEEYMKKKEMARAAGEASATARKEQAGKIRGIDESRGILEKAVKDKAQTIVKTYRGTHETAAASFQSDAKTMAADGYVPINQQWAPGTYGCGMFILAAILCILFVGVLIFIWVLGS